MGTPLPSGSLPEDLENKEEWDYLAYYTVDTHVLAPYPGMTQEDLDTYDQWAVAQETINWCWIWVNILYTVLGIGLLLLLGACAPSIQEVCTRAGLSPGTSPYAECYITTQQLRSQNQAIMNSAILSTYRPTQRTLFSPGVCTSAGCTGQTQ